MIERIVEMGVRSERRLRLVSPGETIEVNRLKSGNAEFQARPVGTDIGEVRLFGLHGGTDLDASGLTSVTVRDGKLIEDSGENLDMNQGLFYVGVEALQGNPFWPNQAL